MDKKEVPENKRFGSILVRFMAWPCDSRQLKEPGLTHFSNQVHVAQFKGTFTMFRSDQCQIWLNNENGNDRDQMGIACTSVTSCWRSKLLA